MWFFTKLVLACTMALVSGAQSTESSGLPPDNVTIIDSEQDKVLAAIPLKDAILREAEELLRTREVYGGLRVPEGMIIRIPLPGGRRIAEVPGSKQPGRQGVAGNSGTFEIQEMLLIWRSKTDHAVILLFDPRHRPHLFQANPVAMGRLLQLLGVEYSYPK